MNRYGVYGALLLVSGLATGVAVGKRAERANVAATGTSGEQTRALSERSQDDENRRHGDWRSHGLQQRFDVLTAELATETANRRRLEQRVEALTTQLAALRAGKADASLPPAGSVAEGGVRRLVVDGRADVPSTGGAAAASQAGDAAGSEKPVGLERALAAAGVDNRIVLDIKKRRDGLDLSMIYLRDLAAREGWLDTPRFTKEMADIESQRTSLRDDIGDDAYDRYLAALEEPNRVAVHEVILDSAAAQAGLQPGDLVVRYGEARIFSQDDLVKATRAGVAGEPVQVEIWRQGQQLAVEVPRGPLGVRIAPAHGAPAQG